MSDAVLLVPPFAHLTWPALGVHVLQAVARARGYRVRVHYGNVAFAARIGELAYSRLCNAPGDWLLGERIFRDAAFGLAPIGLDSSSFLTDLTHPLADGADPTRYVDQLTDVTGETFEGSGVRFRKDELLALSQAAVRWAEDTAQQLAADPARIVGATTSFDQTGAALSVLRRVKALAPHKVTVLGGANCEDAMAEGLASIAHGVDVLASGESEEVFLEVLAGSAPRGVRVGRPCTDLDALPPPDYSDWYAALDAHLPQSSGSLWLSYETSRGCWWGEHHHCTFCGLNGTGMGFRQKSPDKVLADLRTMMADARTMRVCMTDNIMPHAYHHKLVPRLAAELPGLHVFYEQKANLSLAQVQALVDAGIRVIQPGIESLSTPLLRRMNKGVTARQNLALLRYARICGMGVKWNLLYGFPGDAADDYLPMADLLPRITHLCPPNALTHLSIDRFSPYFTRPAEHGLTDLRPWPAYAAIFPPEADLDRLAYHFSARYRSGSREAPDLMDRLYRAVRSWQAAWAGDHPPMLHVAITQTGSVLYDTRGLGGGTTFVLDPDQTDAVLVGGPIERVPAAPWALRRRFAVELDGWCVPLATADARLLAEREAARRAPMAELQPTR